MSSSVAFSLKSFIALLSLNFSSSDISSSPNNLFPKLDKNSGNGEGLSSGTPCDAAVAGEPPSAKLTSQPSFLNAAAAPRASPPSPDACCKNEGAGVVLCVRSIVDAGIGAA